MPVFKTKARAVELLGKNQIADLPTAISELWKNGYDAYGDRFYADLYCPDYKDVKNYTFLIKDDGHGMSYDDLVNKWIVIGTDSKKKSNNITNELDRLDKEPRVPLGEKGIGRLSSAFLGSHMLLLTKKANQDIQLLFINWSVTENYEEFLENIDIPIESISDINDVQSTYNELQYNFRKNLELDSWNKDLILTSLKQEIENDIKKYSVIPKAIIDDLNKWFNSCEHGTIFLVFNPIEELTDLAAHNGITSKKQSNNEAYFYSALSGLFNPFEEKFEIYKDENSEFGTKFYLHKDNSVVNLIKVNEFFTEDDLDNCEHWIKGKFDKCGCFNGKIKVNDEIISYKWKPERLQKETNYGVLRIQLAFMEGQASISLLSNEEYDYYQKKLNNYSGLFIYRDGFRVLPYGRIEQDFLEFEKRRTFRAGTYYFSHRKMFGYLGITKKDNPLLIDKAGREGLTSNKAFKELKQDLTEFFILLAKEHYGTDSMMKQTRDNRKKETKVEKEREKKEREDKKRVIEEQKQLKKELAKYRTQFKIDFEKLKVLKEDIELFDKEIQSTVKNHMLDGIEKVQFFNRYEQKSSQISNMDFDFPSHLPLSNRDIDLYDIYYTEYKKIDILMGSIYNMLLLNCSGRALDEEYKSKLSYIDTKINKEKDEIVNSVSTNFSEIKNDISKQFSKYENEIKALKNEKIDFKTYSENDLRDKVRFIDNLLENYTDMHKNIKEESDYYCDFKYDKNEIDLIKIYKREYGELEKKVREMHELAQLGISIELIDHQFNALYGNISSSLAVLQKRIDPKLLEQFNSMKVSFGHLERNHKMLVPMFRTMRRSRKIITGKSIYDFVMQFFGNEFIDENIVVEVTNDFLKYSYNSFESVIMPVFINIINNAIYWLKSSTKKKIIFTKNRYNEVLVMNSGKKMTELELTKCFDLFYSKKPSGRGMGLYLAKTNLRTVGLDIYATNDPKYNKLEGACFVISEYRRENDDN